MYLSCPVCIVIENGIVVTVVIVSPSGGGGGDGDDSRERLCSRFRHYVLFASSIG